MSKRIKIGRPPCGWIGDIEYWSGQRCRNWLRSIQWPIPDNCVGVLALRDLAAGAYFEQFGAGPDWQPDNGARMLLDY